MRALSASPGGRGPCGSLLLRARQASQRAFPRLPGLPCSSDAATAFPLFDLPAEAVKLVLGLVDRREDTRALRLVCKRTRASVDSRVVAVRDERWPPQPLGEQQLSALVRAPWQLQWLDLSGRMLGPEDAAALAAAAWPSLRVLCLHSNSVGPAGAASLAAAHLPALRELWLGKNNLGPAGAAALAAGHFPAIQRLHLELNSISSKGSALLQARWPTALISA